MSKEYITKLYCPICGKEMDADIHAPADGAKWRTPPGPPDRTTEELSKMDNWICLREPKHHCVVFVPEDIEDWLEDIKE